MATVILGGEIHEYLTPDGGRPGGTHSWTCGQYPKVMASIPLAGGGTVDVYGRASRWTPTHINVARKDDTDHPHSTWAPAGNVRKVTDSEWDIEEY